MRTFGIVLVLLGSALLAVGASTAQAPCKTSFTLVGKTAPDAWYLDGAGEANPVLTACPDAEVTFHIEIVGAMPHAFKVEGGDPQTDVLEEGDTATYTYQTGAAGTSTTYVCPLHSAMKGDLRIAEAEDPAAVKKESPAAGLVGLVVAGLGAALVLRRR